MRAQPIEDGGIDKHRFRENQLVESLGQTQSEQFSTNAHSPQIGWAYDGFPVYGPNGMAGAVMAKCGSAAADSSNCLDECNGQEKTHTHTSPT